MRRFTAWSTPSSWHSAALPALGFVHTGHQLSFVYDIADLYKAEITIPLAFDIAADECPDIGAEARRRMREVLHDGKLLQVCVADIHRLLLDDVESVQPSDDIDFERLSIWDEYSGSVTAGVSYGDPS